MSKTSATIARIGMDKGGLGAKHSRKKACPLLSLHTRQSGDNIHSSSPASSSSSPIKYSRRFQDHRLASAQSSARDDLAFAKDPLEMDITHESRTPTEDGIFPSLPELSLHHLSAIVDDILHLGVEKRAVYWIHRLLVRKPNAHVDLTLVWNLYQLTFDYYKTETLDQEQFVALITRLFRSSGVEGGDTARVIAGVDWKEVEPIPDFSTIPEPFSENILSAVRSVSTQAANAQAMDGHVRNSSQTSIVAMAARDRIQYNSIRNDHNQAPVWLMPATTVMRVHEAIETNAPHTFENLSWRERRQAHRQVRPDGKMWLVAVPIRDEIPIYEQDRKTETSIEAVWARATFTSSTNTIVFLDDINTHWKLERGTTIGKDSSTWLQILNIFPDVELCLMKRNNFGFCHVRWQAVSETIERSGSAAAVVPTIFASLSPNPHHHGILKQRHWDPSGALQTAAVSSKEAWSLLPRHHIRDFFDQIRSWAVATFIIAPEHVVDSRGLALQAHLDFDFDDLHIKMTTSEKMSVVSIVVRTLSGAELLSDWSIKNIRWRTMDDRPAPPIDHPSFVTVPEFVKHGEEVRVGGERLFTFSFIHTGRKLAHLPEPQRTKCWVRMFLEPTKHEGVLLSALWKAYEKTFKSFNDEMNPYLSDMELLHIIQHRFKKCSEIEMSAEMHTIHGIRLRPAPLSISHVLEHLEERMRSRTRKRLDAMQNRGDLILRVRDREMLNFFQRKLTVDPLLSLSSCKTSPWIKRLRWRAQGRPLGDYQPGFPSVSMKRLATEERILYEATKGEIAKAALAEPVKRRIEQLSSLTPALYGRERNLMRKGR